MLDALAILLFGVGLVRAQEPRNHSLATPGEVVPQAEKIFIVPAAVYEVERAAPYRPAAITTVDFRDSSSVPSNVSAEDFKEPRPTDGFRFWARGEYLLWRVTGAPVAVPLVTTNNPPAIGALNEPGTTVLFGAGSGPDVNFGKFSGGRVTIGAWLEDDHEYSLEATAFLLQRRGFLFSASTVGGGAQVVSIPFNATDPFNGNPAGESALNAGAAPSSATVYLASRLFGGELNETIHLWSTETFYWSTLLGFRYVGLREELTLTHSSHDAGNSGTLSVNDAYATRSQFYGGQLGTRFGMSVGRFGLETAVKGRGRLLEPGRQHQWQHHRDQRGLRVCERHDDRRPLCLAEQYWHDGPHGLRGRAGVNLQGERGAHAADSLLCCVPGALRQQRGAPGQSDRSHHQSEPEPVLRPARQPGRNRGAARNHDPRIVAVGPGLAGWFGNPVLMIRFRISAPKAKNHGSHGWHG